MLEFLRSPLSYLDRLVQQYGGAVGLKLGGERVVLLADPALSRIVLIDQAKTFVKVATNPSLLLAPFLVTMWPCMGS